MHVLTLFHDEVKFSLLIVFMALLSWACSAVADNRADFWETREYARGRLWRDLSLDFAQYSQGYRQVKNRVGKIPI